MKTETIRNILITFYGAFFLIPAIVLLMMLGQTFKYLLEHPWVGLGVLGIALVVIPASYLTAYLEAEPERREKCPPPTPRNN